MSTIIKLLITALVLNACFQGGRSAWGFYQFQDEVQQAVLFSTTQSAEQLKARIANAAAEMQKDLDPETFSVAYLGTQANIEGQADETFVRETTRQLTRTLDAVARAAAEVLARAGIQVVQDRCLKVEWGRFR